MKFEWKEGLIWVKIEVVYEGSNYLIDHWLVDTGVVAQTIDGLTIDAHQMNNVEIEFGNIRADMGINGFIGNDLLSAFTLIINYATQEIEFIREECN